MTNKIYIVEFTKFAAKQLQRVPIQIREAVFIWKSTIELEGLPNVMKLKGYHDEPLKGERYGQRSIRLNRSYRLIYEKVDRQEIVIIGVMEINKHDY